ncbi:MAG: AEC family transporter [Clostridia bacterium]|nr:AEC family transporter [Clostridia bacterium]
MLESLRIASEAVIPLFICMALGFFLRARGTISTELAKELNRLCFRIFLPIYLFQNMYNTDLSEAAVPGAILFSAAAILGLFGLLMVIIPLMEKDNPRRGSMVQAIFRSNYALFGLPLAISLCGEANSGLASLLLGINVPMYNILAVFCLEFFRGGKVQVKRVLKNIVTNPLIVALALGALCRACGLVLPTALSKPVTDLGRVATPLSLVALGASLKPASISRNRRPLTIILLCKVLFCPLLIIGAAILAGFRGDTLVPLMIMAAAPTAVSSFPMAQMLGGDADLAGEAVALTTAAAVPSLFIWITLLKQFSMI